MNQGLGTQLRHLIELLDGDVALAYEEAGLDYRPRYTPVMRALGSQQQLAIGELAAFAGITQPAATQTVTLMKKQGLVKVVAGKDGRQRLVTLSAAGRAMLPRLQRCWAATSAAAASLDAELDHPLSATLAQAIVALQASPFIERIRAARAASKSSTGETP